MVWILADATFDSFVRDIHQASWQSWGPHNPRTCLSGTEPRLRTYNAWVARLATTHDRTLFRLPLLPKCVRLYLVSEWAATICPGMLGAEINFPENTNLQTVPG